MESRTFWNVPNTLTVGRLGLAAVVSGIAVLAITAKSWFSRASFEGGLVRALPAVSAAVILVVGLAMTLRAVPGVL